MAFPFTTPDLFSLEGRRALLTLTLGLMALGLVLRLGLLAFSEPAALLQPTNWLPLVVAATLLLIARRRWPLRIIVTLSVLVFSLVALQDLREALLLGNLPRGLSLWTPAVIIEVFLLLGSSAGLAVTGAFGALLLGVLLWHLPLALVIQQAWINLVLATLLLTWLGYGLSRFLERTYQRQESSSAALVEARQDALTRVLGRAAIEDELSLALERAEAHGGPLSLVVCDLDHFKAVNDRHGHAVGDEVLRGVARLLRRSVGQGNSVGRWGGEEFLLVVPISKPDALGLAEQLRRDIQASQVAGLRVTVSLGVAAYRSGESATSVFARADRRLYAAKRAGRNTVR